MKIEDLVVGEKYWFEDGEVEYLGEDLCTTSIYIRYDKSGLCSRTIAEHIKPIPKPKVKMLVYRNNIGGLFCAFPEYEAISSQWERVPHLDYEKEVDDE